jgi:GT2 family glycosyltransferase
MTSVIAQSLYPNEIIVVDGSKDKKTKDLFEKKQYAKTHYFGVSQCDRGLTKQRNIGVQKVSDTSEIICFLDDDTILSPTYFEALIATYDIHKSAIAVGGYIENEITWIKGKSTSTNTYGIDGFYRKDGSRFLLRKKLGLVSSEKPGIMPLYSHGRSIGYLPPSGTIYPVEFFMGGVSSYKRIVFNSISFSEYFEGYGLYEDLDFCLRLNTLGDLFVNTNAKLGHYHEASGRPNQFHYGKMVVRNGWYVWRVKFNKPTFKARVLWNATALLLTLVRFSNIFTSKEKLKALTETLGRIMGWFSLIISPPKVAR